MTPSVTEEDRLPFAAEAHWHARLIDVQVDRTPTLICLASLQ